MPGSGSGRIPITTITSQPALSCLEQTKPDKNGSTCGQRVWRGQLASKGLPFFDPPPCFFYFTAVVYHSLLTNEQTELLERLQRRALCIIKGSELGGFDDCLSSLNILSLKDRRLQLINSAGSGTQSRTSMDTTLERSMNTGNSNVALGVYAIVS